MASPLQDSQDPIACSNTACRPTARACAGICASSPAGHAPWLTCRRLRLAIADSAARLIARRRGPAAPDFPPDLPVNQRKDEIAAAIRDNQVVIVCGETGSGKTTQLPKICLELGRGVSGLIGHTQPRRIAARATATRIAQELKSELGAVGFKIRFTDRIGPRATSS